MDTPNPGSKEAMLLGCRCPRMDNEYGAGCYVDAAGVPQFWINGSCPLHAASVIPIEEAGEEVPEIDEWEGL